MAGFLFCAISGMAMSLQGVMNTRLSEKIGLYESNVFVQGTAFLLSIAAVLIAGKGDFSEVFNADRQYLLGGPLGLIITVTVMLGIKSLNPTLATSVILISQLFVAALIDAFGWLGMEKTGFGWNKYAGLVFMVGGVIMFKLPEISKSMRWH